MLPSQRLVQRLPWKAPTRRRRKASKSIGIRYSMEGADSALIYGNAKRYSTQERKDAHRNGRKHQGGFAYMGT